jgi:hypothetical protein
MKTYTVIGDEYASDGMWMTVFLFEGSKKECEEKLWNYVDLNIYRRLKIVKTNKKHDHVEVYEW